MNKDEKQEKTKEIEKIEDIVDDKEKEEPVIISTEEDTNFFLKIIIYLLLEVLS